MNSPDCILQLGSVKVLHIILWLGGCKLGHG